ncbi:aminotransferase class IV family protein [Stenotrophomonas sp. MMGLT7]|uniref:aminotransferase class IV family protein n=1 Tax=Stenotrophomonas sp. MMGLT7 TaxID=2901227 RepID=UPI001E591063|nr:aminotransferase class IV family protein [Stenotrophomonas sp. MMGLT7]
MSVLLCNGHPADAEALAAAALVNYGHFTSMQVRAGAVRGLHLHLQRLRQGTQALFGTDLDERRVRADLRAALAAFGDDDASLRVTVFSRRFDFRDPLRAVAPDLLVAATPASALPAPALRLRSLGFVRDSPGLKHVGTFPLFHYRRQALAAGFDDALFVDPQGSVVEGTVWNLGLWDGRRVIWPQGPALRGTQERLLQAGLDELGVPQVVQPVPLELLGAKVAAFACNARGQQVVDSVDGHALARAPELPALLQRALETQPLQPL